MDKEQLTEKRVRMDLVRLLEARRGRMLAWRLFYIIPGIPLAVLLGFFFDSVWIALLAVCYTVYHIASLISEQRRHSELGCAIFGGLGDGAIAISEEKLIEVVEESVFDPHRGIRHQEIVRTAKFLCFESGKRWRTSTVGMPLARGERIETERSVPKLGCTAVPGDEFYFIALADDPEIGMLYRKLDFELTDGKLA